jgi:hypothetical protein
VKLEKHHSPQIGEKSEGLWSKILMALITSAFVIVGQYYMQPRIMEKQSIRTMRVEQKREVYLQAVSLVNRLWASSFWASASHVDNTYNPRSYPSVDEVNDCTAKLLIVSDSTNIPFAFSSLFSLSTTNGALKSEDRLPFFQMLRQDLYGDSINVLSNVPFYFELPKH